MKKENKLLARSQDFIREWGWNDDYECENVSFFMDENNNPSDNSIELHNEHLEHIQRVMTAGLNVKTKGFIYLINTLGESK